MANNHDNKSYFDSMLDNLHNLLECKIYEKGKINYIIIQNSMQNSIVIKVITTSSDFFI